MCVCVCVCVEHSPHLPSPSPHPTFHATQDLDGCASLTPSSSGYYFVNNATVGASLAQCDLGEGYTLDRVALSPSQQQQPKCLAPFSCRLPSPLTTRLLPCFTQKPGGECTCNEITECDSGGASALSALHCAINPCLLPFLAPFTDSLTHTHAHMHAHSRSRTNVASLPPSPPHADCLSVYPCTTNDGMPDDDCLAVSNCTASPFDTYAKVSLSKHTRTHSLTHTRTHKHTLSPLSRTHTLPLPLPLSSSSGDG